MGVFAASLAALCAAAALASLPALLLAARAPGGRRAAPRGRSSRAFAALLLVVAGASGAGAVAAGLGVPLLTTVAVTVSLLVLGAALVRPPASGRPAPKRRAPQPSLASRVALPATAAVGTGAALVLVTSGTAGAPAPRGDDTAAVSVATQASPARFAGDGDRLTGRPASAVPTPATASTEGMPAGETTDPAPAPTATATPEPTPDPDREPEAPAPTAAPTPKPTEGPRDPEPTPQPPEPSETPVQTAGDDPGLVGGLLEGVGGVVGGLLGGTP